MHCSANDKKPQRQRKGDLIFFVGKKREKRIFFLLSEDNSRKFLFTILAMPVLLSERVLRVTLVRLG